MILLQQLLFMVVLFVAIRMIWRRALVIRSQIQLGREEAPLKEKTRRWKNVFLVAFGQQKMYKKFIPAFLHSWIYVGFLVINLEVIEFTIDGLAGTHRFFAPYMSDLYNGFVNTFEFFAVAVLVSCMVFLIRRNIIKVDRLRSPEMTSWPRLDGNLILIIEMMLVIAILKMNAFDQILQQRGVDGYPDTGTFFFSQFLIPTIDYFDTKWIIVGERITWWFHIIGILGFAVYITYSKHLHILLAFFNTYYAKLTPKGYLDNMPAVTNEVKMLRGDLDTNTVVTPSRFGAKDVHDLSRRSLLGAYACTECGRCTDSCPAHLVGQKLSPRRIMMATRDRMEKALTSDSKKNETLLGDYISKEEINACTSCNACVESCPIMINPLEIIIELRRYVAMEESGTPASWNAMFQNIETNFAPWKFPSSDRFEWASPKKHE